jgi:8-oxo-dGTP pyrophosphatase MutT (NUDIX family)
MLTAKYSLIRFVVSRDGMDFSFWATPGGSVEVGKSDLDAAQRELKEELALSVALAGPIHTAVTRFSHLEFSSKTRMCFLWEG